MFHKIAHLLRWNYGRVKTWWRDDGQLMVGFECSKCGKLSGVHESYFGTKKDPLMRELNERVKKCQDSMK